MPESVPNILLVDDHDLFRSGLRMIIESLPQTDEKVYEASTGENSLAVVRDKPIDIVFMDYSLPGMDGITTSLRLLQINQNLKIIILTGLHQLPASRVVLQAGIRGYMTKSSATEEVGQAIDSVMRGGTYLSHEIARQSTMAGLQAQNKVNPLDSLSRRELQVALLLMNGHKPTVVGDLLLLSPKSVSTYKRRAFEKLAVDSLVQLVELGMSYGFLGDLQKS